MTEIIYTLLIIIISVVVMIGAGGLFVKLVVSGEWARTPSMIIWSLGLVFGAMVAVLWVGF